MTGPRAGNPAKNPDAAIVVIGSGPAGMAASHAAAEYGVSVVLLDEQPALGGQIYRNVEMTKRERPDDYDLLGVDYQEGRHLADRVKASAVRYICGATVWNIETDPLAVYYSVNGQARKLAPTAVIIATGAMERSVPIPGWTLPGVMGAGAAQVMLKSSGMIPEGRVAIAGAGPLLLLVADQLSRAGCNLVGVAETTSYADYIRAAPLLPRAMRASSYLKKGLGLRFSLMRRGVRLLSGAKNMRAEGDRKFERLVFNCGRREVALDADLLLMHEGVVPNVQLSRQMGLEHEWYDRQDYWRPVLSKWGETSRKGVFVAGDGGGIDGATVAAHNGTIASLKIVQHLGCISESERNRRAEKSFREKKKHEQVRPMLDTLFGPPRYAFQSPARETIICRCSEVTAGEISDAIAAGCHTPDSLKSKCRSGMGACQGRMCGLSVSTIISRALEMPIDQVGYYNIRSPIIPLPLCELAALEEEGTPSSAYE